MILLLGLALSLGVDPAPPASAEACTSNITVGTIQVDAPQYTPDTVGDAMPIRAVVNSACQIQTVMGEAFGHSVSFVYNPNSGTWGGVFDLTADTHTPFTLTITATDINSTQAAGTRNLIHDTPPVLTITAPVHSAVARPSLQVTVSCVDDDPAGCSSVTMIAPYKPGSPTLASGVSGINQTISLAAYEGVGVAVRFVAVDSRGQAVGSPDRFLFVESSPYLVEVANAPGTILDDSPDRTLFLADDKHPSVLEKSDGQIVQLSTAAYWQLDGRVTDHGALSETKSTGDWHFYGWDVVQLRDGVVTTVTDGSGIHQSVQVKGNYGLVGAKLFGDLDAGTWADVPVPNTDGGSGVGPNGDFVYSTGSPRQIFRYRAGIPTQLTSSGVASVSPDTDGVNVAYKQVNGSGYTLALRLITDGGDILLSDFAGYNNYFASPSRDYVTNGGWTAFTKPLNGFITVWRRAPDGTISQASFFGNDAFIDALGSDGAVSIRSLSRLWLVSPDGAEHEVSQFHNALVTGSPSLATHIGTRSFFRDGDLYQLIGASAFKFVPAPTITAQPTNQIATFGQTATLSVTVSGTGPFTYQWYIGTSGDTSNPIAGATSSNYTTPPVSGPLTSPTRYWVRISSLTGSVDSTDALVTIPFTDDPLLAGVTMIQAVHVNELRARIDGVRGKYLLPPSSYSPPSITAGVSIVLAQSILELRTALAQAYTAAGQTPPSYVTSPATGVPILAADIASLRSAIVAIE